MFDDVCCALRDVVHDAIDADIMSEDSVIRDEYALEVESMTMQFIDNGLAVKIDGILYGITIERV